MASALAALGAVAVCAPAAAATPEARVKAAYLYKLASFVRWPDETGQAGRFRFCVAGSKEISQVLTDLVRGERVLGMPISVEQVGAAATAQARQCDILFVARGRDAARALIGAAGGQPILTVADRNGGTNGGVVDFILRDGKVRFVIDRRAARRQQLELSSKLLDTALAVEP